MCEDETTNAGVTNIRTEITTAADGNRYFITLQIADNIVRETNNSLNLHVLDTVKITWEAVAFWFAARLSARWKAISKVRNVFLQFRTVQRPALSLLGRLIQFILKRFMAIQVTKKQAELFVRTSNFHICLQTSAFWASADALQSRL